MLEIRERAETTSDGARAESGPVPASPLTLTLPFELRQRSRQRVILSSGDEAAVLLARGTVLRGGDALRLSDGRAVRVEAAAESVSTVRSDDAQKLARVAYHLGNRHVPLEVGAGYVRYLHDHVLDAMVQKLGLAVIAERAPFEPESGAYGAHGHAHSHGHGHEHGHGHAHAREHDHAHGHAHAREHDHARAGEHAHADGHAHAHEGAEWGARGGTR